MAHRQARPSSVNRDPFRPPQRVGRRFRSPTIFPGKAVVHAICPTLPQSYWKPQRADDSHGNGLPSRGRNFGNFAGGVGPSLPFQSRESTGRGIADQVKLPFRLVEPLLQRLKIQQMVAYASATTVNDYVHVLSDAGRDRAKRYLQKTTYFGAAPVKLSDYIASVKLQSVEHQHPTREDLRNAFSDLLVPPQLLARLGPAINSGRGMFLYGYPGNGKTSIAERVTRAFGEYIWIPRAILVDTDIIRIFDPMMHEAAEDDENPVCSTTPISIDVGFESNAQPSSPEGNLPWPCSKSLIMPSRI